MTFENAQLAIDCVAPPSERPPVPFAEGLHSPKGYRGAIDAAHRQPEPDAVDILLAEPRLTPAGSEAASQLSAGLIRNLRQQRTAGGRAGLVQALLQQYALSSQEGIALMCLAEALLRIPDAPTRDALIRDKIANGGWEAHAGRSPSIFVNATTWGLLLTGKLVAPPPEGGLSNSLVRLVGKGGEPLVRKGVDLAMRMMGEQFVCGETIGEAMTRSKVREAQGFRHAYDLLGGAALTAPDAARHLQALRSAIDAIGTRAGGRGPIGAAGISIRLSALHPRYGRTQHGRVMAELYPLLLDLVLRARRHDIGIQIDAEEADRLDLSLDLLQRLCHEPALGGFNGIGFVVQACQKRCLYVVDFLIDLAMRSRHRLMVRLVKGACWDGEIKRAQVDGLDDYAVFTRKAHTDLSYLACARRLLAAPAAVYPQFATHNAHTLAAVYQMADPSRYEAGQYEFQCLHGMGEALYRQVVRPVAEGGLGRVCRIDAPVGTHGTLLAYLVRRLLENGANGSFVHRLADPGTEIEQLIEDPAATIERMAIAEGRRGLAHPAIASPRRLLGDERANSRGLDLSNEACLAWLADQMQDAATASWQAEPMLASDSMLDRSPRLCLHVRNPADRRDVVGMVKEAFLKEAHAAVTESQAYAPTWAAVAPRERADRLDRAADRLEQAMPRLIGLLAREAGQTCASGIAEVRGAVDLLRFYAAQVRRDFDPATHRPLGPVVCISPWNSPLAIFVGQLAAALAAGNTVLAKPAEQTPLVAAEAVRLLWSAGIPRAALQLLPGAGKGVGAALVADARVQGVMFTGSIEVARQLQRSLAQRLASDGRPVPLVAETGGQNAMIVDSSALLEQVVRDILGSAFDSAGQRCSALRVLCVQEDIADRLVAMLKGAMAECRIGDPARLSVDVGPVIDDEARRRIERHVASMQKRGRPVFRAALPIGDETRHGSFVLPTLIEITHFAELDREVFGPVLHVLRFPRLRLRNLVGQINATGYGLTLGVHTRIDGTVDEVVREARVGNVFVNRDMVGAVVGMQPFGGEGLSGTGPKAGGPLYLYRLLSRRPDDLLCRVMPPDASGAGEGHEHPESRRALRPAVAALAAWAASDGRPALEQLCIRYDRLSRSGASRLLAGPTGERNLYSLVPRSGVLCIADEDADRLTQLAAVLAAGSVAIWPAGQHFDQLRERLPQPVRRSIELAHDWRSPTTRFAAVLHHGDADSLLQLLAELAERVGPIATVRTLAPGEKNIPLEALVTERSLSINTAAAGGNASLMAIG